MDLADGERPGLQEAGQYVVLVRPDRKGGDPAEWPPDLRVQEFPSSALITASP